VKLTFTKKTGCPGLIKIIKFLNSRNSYELLTTQTHYTNYTNLFWNQNFYPKTNI